MAKEHNSEKKIFSLEAPKIENLPHFHFPPSVHDAPMWSARKGTLMSFLLLPPPSPSFHLLHPPLSSFSFHLLPPPPSSSFFHLTILLFPTLSFYFFISLSYSLNLIPSIFHSSSLPSSLNFTVISFPKKIK